MCGVEEPECDEPWRYHVDTTAVVERRPAERMHDPAQRPFRRRVLGPTWNVQERGTRPDQHQAGIFLVGPGFDPILLNEVMDGKLHGVQPPD